VARSGDKTDNAGTKRHFWVDAQLPPALARWLGKERGLDASHVADLGLLGASDQAIFAAARDTDRHVVLLTKDDDFVKLLRQYGPPPQVVWVRCGNVTNQNLRHIVLAAWPRAEALLAVGEDLVEVRKGVRDEAS